MEEECRARGIGKFKYSHVYQETRLDTEATKNGKSETTEIGDQTGYIKFVVCSKCNTIPRFPQMTTMLK